MKVFEILLLGLAVVLCFRGRGTHRDWVILAGTLPLLHLLFSRDHRQHTRSRIRRYWEQLGRYHLEAGRVPLRAVFFLVVCPAAALYLASDRSPGPGGGDSSPVVPMAIRFVGHGDFRLDEHVGDPGSFLAIKSRADLPYYVRQTPSGLYTNYPAGMSTFAMPMVAIAHLVGADWHRPATPGRIEKWTASWLAATTAGIFLLIALRLASPGPAMVCTVLVAASSSLFSTTSQDLSQQGGVIFWVLVALWVEVHWAGQPSRLGILLQAIACGWALTCRPSAAILVGSLLLWILVRSPWRAVATGLLAAVAFAPWGVFYWQVYHSLLGPTDVQANPDAWARIPGQHILGVLFSPARGFFVYHPWLLVIALVPWMGLRRTNDPEQSPSPGLRGLSVFLAVVCILHTLLVASWGMWWGGHSWGPRLATEVVPFAALLALSPIAWLCERPVGRCALIILGVAGLWMHWAGTYLNGLAWDAIPCDVDAHPERLWDWSNPPFIYAVHARRSTHQHSAARQRAGAMITSAPAAGPSTQGTR